MEERQCPSCPHKGPPSDFYESGGKRRPECKTCFKKQMRPRSADHYQKNRKQYIARNAARRAAIASLVRTFKTGKTCTDCGLPHPFWRLDFDHLGSKDVNLSAIAKTGWSNERVMAEIAKCELVCANCHRDRTQARQSI